MNSEDRFVDIEIKLARQEDLVETLNQMVYQQQKKIDQLEGLCSALARQFKDVDHDSAGGSLAHERPPHY